MNDRSEKQETRIELDHVIDIPSPTVAYSLVKMRELEAKRITPHVHRTKRPVELTNVPLNSAARVDINPDYDYLAEYSFSQISGNEYEKLAFEKDEQSGRESRHQKGALSRASGNSYMSEYENAKRDDFNRIKRRYRKSVIIVCVVLLFAAACISRIR